MSNSGRNRDPELRNVPGCGVSNPVPATGAVERGAVGVEGAGGGGSGEHAGLGLWVLAKVVVMVGCTDVVKK